MRLRAILIMAVVETAAWAAPAGGTEARRVTVCMGGDSGEPLYAVERMASEIFSTIGVRIEWRGRTCPAFPDVIKIDFAETAPKGISDGALAYARPYEGTHIVILNGRVKQQSGCTQQLLAYVLVHEITHILEAVNRHSESGIMKAHWTHRDYYDMERHALIFAPEDVESIYRGIDTRPARMGSGSPVQVAAR